MLNDYIKLDNLEPQHNDQHRKVFQFALGCMEKLFTSVPTTDQVPVGYMAFYESGSTRRIYINFYGTMRYVGLT